MGSTDKTRTPGALRAPPGQNLKSEYGHSSGDRNTRTDEHDWKHFKDGKVRTEHVDAPREPSSDPRRRLDPNP
jgi:hypothetical protein